MAKAADVAVDSGSKEGRILAFELSLVTGMTNRTSMIDTIVESLASATVEPAVIGAARFTWQVGSSEQSSVMVERMTTIAEALH